VRTHTLRMRFLVGGGTLRMAEGIAPELGAIVRNREREGKGAWACGVQSHNLRNEFINALGHIVNIFKKVFISLLFFKKYLYIFPLGSEPRFLGPFFYLEN
jgi:hypothetical protein